MPENCQNDQGGDRVVIKSKVQTVKITSVLTFGFFVCWTLVNILILWRWIDRTSAPSALRIWYFAVYCTLLWHGCFSSSNKFFGKRKQHDLTKKQEVGGTKTFVKMSNVDAK